MKVVYTDCAKTFNKETGCELDTNHSGGGTYRSGNTIYIYLPFCVKTGFEIPDVAHEAFHAADFVSDWVGMEYKEASGNEHIAYLITFFTEYIFDCGSKIMKKDGE